VTTASIDGSTEQGAHALERLAGERIAWLTTVTADGQPQTLPIWFLWEDGTILLYSQAGAVRNRNLEANDLVSFHLADDGSGGDIVEIEGRARFDEAAPSAKDHPVYLAKYADLLAAASWTPVYFSDHYPHAVRITPERIRVF
jgi:PPOX class probable F420-dependent enzyme